MNTLAYLFTEQFIVDSFINNTHKLKFLLKGLECYKDKLTQMKACNITHAKQLSVERCAFKLLANFLLTEHPQLTSHSTLTSTTLHLGA